MGVFGLIGCLEVLAVPVRSDNAPRCGARRWKPAAAAGQASAEILACNRIAGKEDCARLVVDSQESLSDPESAVAWLEHQMGQPGSGDFKTCPANNPGPAAPTPQSPYGYEQADTLLAI